MQSKDIETIINEWVSKKKLSFERCNFIIDKDIIFDSKFESTLTEIILTDVKFTEESFEIFAKAIRGNESILNIQNLIFLIMN